jgi:membrane-associated protein
LGSDFLLYWLGDQLVRIGPGLLFALCLLETAVFIGLVIPVGALIGVAALLSARGVFEFSEVALAATAGAVVGDQIGFAVGRWFVPSGRPARGTISGLWQGALRRTEALVRSRGLIGVSAARTIPFVRTIMPWFAGRSGMRWGRFFLFDLIGIAGWAAVYLGGGFAAGYGWRAGVERYGEVVGGALVLLVALVLLGSAQLWARRLLRRLRRRRAGGGGPA